MTKRQPPAVLLLEEPTSAEGDEACLDLLTDSRRPRSVLSVRCRGSVDECATRLRARADGVESAAFVAVNPVTPAGQDANAVRTVSNPGDLTGIGVGVVEWLAARSDDDDPAVCIDDVSTMVQYTGVERAFRLLHALAGKCRDSEASFHAHLTPSAHDDRTVATLRQVFDEQRRVRSTDSGADADASAVTAGAESTAGRHGD